MARRAAREPLQHLTGSTGFRHVELQVGAGRLRAPPGDRAARRLGDRPGPRGGGATPVVVDLCTGSGAIAASIADEVPDAPACTPSSWTRRPSSGPSATWPAAAVDLRLGDMADAFPDLDGTVDVVVVQPAVHPARGVRERRPRGPRPRPGAGAVVGGGRARRDAGARGDRRPAAPAGRLGRRRARGRAGRVGDPGLPRGRSLDRRTRPRGPGRSSALRRRRGWHDDHREEEPA